MSESDAALKLRLEARKLVARRKYKKALAVYKELLTLVPDDPGIWVRTGDVLLKLDQPRTAIRLLTRAAMHYTVSGHLVQAISVNKLILEVDPNHTATLNAMAELYSTDRSRSKLSKAQRDAAQQAAYLYKGQAEPQSTPGTKTTEEDLGLQEIEERYSATVDSELAQLDAPNDETISTMLPTIPLFADLDAGEITRLIQEIDAVQVAAGDTVFQEGDAGESMWIVTNGAARVSKRDLAGNEIEIQQLGSSDIFGEYALCTGLPRPTTVTAITDLALLRLTRSAIGALSQNHPEIGTAIETFYQQRLVSRVLKVCPIFAPLEPSEREQILLFFNLVALEAGRQVTRQGEPGPGKLYIVVSGEIDVAVADDNGNNRVFATLTEGHYFGEISLLIGGASTATCTVKRKSHVYELDGEVFADLLERYPKVRKAVEQVANARMSEAERIRLAAAEPDGQFRYERVRKQKRLPVPNGQIRLTHASISALIGAYVLDLSEGGLFVETPVQLEAGTNLEISVHFDGADSAVSALAEVVRFGRSAMLETGKGLALKLVHIEDDSQEHLTSWLQQLDSQRDSLPMVVRSKTRILVVDDSEFIRIMAADKLRDAGYQVETHEDAFFSEKLSLFKPDMVLLDVNLGVLSGVSGIEMSRADGSAEGAVIVLYSARAESELAALTRDSGADAYLLKTESMDHFVESVETLAARLLGTASAD